MHKGDLIEFYYKKSDGFSLRNALIKEIHLTYITAFTEKGFRSFKKKNMSGVIVSNAGTTWQVLHENMAKAGYQL